MRRCTRCILPETYPDIIFNEEGVCNKCLEYEKKWANRDFEELRERLKNIFSWAKKQGKRYDCLVPFSGGKDSTYTLYICRKVYGLKALAVNFNNGLRTIESVMNIENSVKKLDVASMCLGLNWGLMRRLYKEFFMKTGQFCFPCDMGIWATTQRIAEQMDIPLIVSGFSIQIESRGGKIYSYNQNLFRNIVKNNITTAEQKSFLPIEKSQRIICRLKKLKLTRYRRQISLPDYMEWNDNNIKDTIKREVQWDQGKKTGDHVDCLFAPMKNYLVIQKWGFGEKTTKYSAMVRAGQIKREEALERVLLEEDTKEKPEVIHSFMETLKVSMKDIETAKMKSHLQFL
ncbi:MAG: N-acetyl sugar amidotransferase [bacterium]